MRDTPAKVADRFLKDTAYHTMTIHLDHGLYRHLEFSHNHGSNCRYDLLTYPGGLVIRGDMGTYVFERTPDMFKFFDKGGRVHETNPFYWSEKVQAQDRQSHIWEFDQALASEQVLTELKEWEADENERSVFNRKAVDPEELKELQENRAEEIRSFLREVFSEEMLRAGLDEVFPGPDWSDVQFDEYTFHFLWCLCAIVKGIHVYHTNKEKL